MPTDTEITRAVKLVVKSVPGFKLLDDGGKKHVLGLCVSRLCDDTGISHMEASTLLREALGMEEGR